MTIIYHTVTKVKLSIASKHKGQRSHIHYKPQKEGGGLHG